MESEPSSSAATSTSLVRKRTDTELMPPPPPAKRIKRPKNVLDEDTYTEALSKIIARDFFPGLLESETQQEYLDALQSKDQEWIAIATRRLQHVMTPGRRATPFATPRFQAGQTPRGFVGDTPASVASSAAASSTASEEKTPAVDTNMSLAAFQSRYTSEDNESFYKLLDRQNQKRAEKYAWLWTGNKLPSKMQLKQKETEDRLSKARSLTNDGFEKKQLLAIKDKDDRPAAPDTWKWQPKNNLMFTGDGIQEEMETLMEQAEAESRAPPKTILYGNTRVPDPNGVVVQPNPEEPSRPPSPTLSAVRDAIKGQPRPEDRDSAIGSAAGGETPRVNGYAFVEDEEPEPPALRRSSSEPIIILGPGDAVPNPFKISERRGREALHHRMVDRIAESRRASARQGMVGKTTQTPTPKLPHSPRITGALTPAAQRLWSNLGNSGTRRSRVTPFGGKGTTRSKASAVKQKGAAN